MLRCGNNCYSSLASTSRRYRAIGDWLGTAPERGAVELAFHGQRLATAIWSQNIPGIGKRVLATAGMRWPHTPVPHKQHDRKLYRWNHDDRAWYPEEQGVDMNVTETTAGRG